MSVRAKMTVTQMLPVEIRLDPTHVNAKQATMGTE